MFPLGQPSEITSATSVDVIGIDYLSVALPFFILSIVIELVVIFLILPASNRPKHTPRINDSISSLGLGILQVLSARLIFLNWFAPLYTFVYENLRITGSTFSDSNDPAVWWSCLIFCDFLYYWFHRLSHEISWMWTTHVVHHSSEEYNLTTALRQPALDFFAPSFLISSLAAALIFPWPLFSVHSTFNLLYQFWIHTQLVPPLPLVETVFNTPSLHRIHHARNIRALGKNYGAIFSLWDRMFGTFEPEVSEKDTDELYFGVIPQLRSFDPIFSNCHHFYHMIWVQTKWDPWYLAPFRHWTPVRKTGGKCPSLGSKMNPKSKFDANPPTFAWKVYASAQFLIVLIGVALYLETDPNEALHDYLFPRMGDDVFLSLVGTFVFLVVLWSFSNVGSIMTLGCKGTTATRGSILFNELARHTFVCVMPLAVVIVKGLNEARDAAFFAVAYSVVNYIFLFSLRNEIDRIGGTGEGFEGDEDMERAQPLIVGESGGNSVSTWTWYTHSKYN